MRIQHNIMAMNAYRNYTNNTSALSKNLEKLSSGYRINRAGDDAAGLAISEKMRAQITGLETAQKNAKDGISLVQTAEGALTEVHDMLNRMVELADQSANGTYDNDVDRENLQKELNQLREEVDRIADSANFNGIKLLNGHLSDAVGVTSTQGGEVAGTGLDSILGQNGVTTITEGKLTEGTAEKQAGAHIYMGDTLQASVTQANTTNTTGTQFELVLGNGNGGSVTITFTMATGSSVLGSKAEVQMSDILLAIQNGASTQQALTTVTDGTATVAITGSINGTDANLEDVLKLYDMSMDGEQLKITAKATGSISGVNNVKAEDLSVSIKVSADTVDKTEMEAGIKADLDGDGAGNAPEDVKLGSSSWGQEHGVSAKDAEYTKASMVVTMKSGASIESGSAIKIGDMTYVMLKQGDTLTDELKAFVSAGGASVEVVTFDATKTNGGTSANAGSAAYELMRAINANSSSASVFAASVSTNGDLVLQETEDYAKAVLSDASNPNPTSKPDALGTLLKNGEIGDSNYTYGAEGKKNQITFSGTGDKGLQVGTTLEIGGKTYEFATSIDKVKEGNGFIQFTAGDNDANAQALAEALKEDGITTATVVDNDDGDPMVQFDLNTKVGEFNCKGLTLQIGDTSDTYNQLSVVIDATDCESLGIDASKVSIADQTSAADAVDILKQAINKVSSIRGTLGATQNRLDHTINNLSVMTENIQDAESTIRDTDVADEMMAYTKNNILIQSAQAMLAQANQVPQGVLQLLQ